MHKNVSSLIGVMLAMAWVAFLVPEHATRAAEGVDAARIYHASCSVCHGEQGDGRSRAIDSMRPPPRDFTAPQAVVDLDRARMISAVRDGRPGTAMAAWSSQLSEAEITALVDYIRQRFMRATITADGERGRKLYAGNCSVCHGDNGEGALWTRSSLKPPPRNFTTSSPVELSRERMLRAVTYGRSDTAMPGFGTRLAEHDIEAIVDYVRGAFMMPAPAGPAAGKGHGEPHGHASGAAASKPHAHDMVAPGMIAADMSLPFPAGLQGDAKRGETLYRSNCAACHGADGDGRGPRAYFILPNPRDFTHPASRHSLNRPALFEAIAMGNLGTEMPAWSKVLDDQSIADVSEYVYRRFIIGELASGKPPAAP
jgi:mono/diheme cytochrome c family protein